MKTIEVKEIVIDLTKSDSRSGSTIFARVLYDMFKRNDIDVEYKFNPETLSNISKSKLTTLYPEDKALGSDGIINQLQYYKDKKISITIIPE